jgi:hypothetical protein
MDGSGIAIEQTTASVRAAAANHAGVHGRPPARRVPLARQERRGMRYQLRPEASDPRTYAVVDTQRGTARQPYYLVRFVLYARAVQIAWEAETAGV